MQLLTLVTALALAASPAPQELDSLRKEVMQAELALHEQVRMFRDCSNPDTAFGARLGEEAGRLNVKGFAVEPIDAGEPVSMAGGAQSPVRLTRAAIRGHGDFYDVRLLLERIAFERAFRTLDFESLSMKPAEGGTMAFEGRVVEACWDTTWRPPAPVQLRERDPIKAETALYRGRLEDLQAVAGTMRELGERMQPRRALQAVAVAEGEWEELPLMLSEAHLAGSEVTLRGVVLGSQFEAAVEPALRKGGFAEPRIDWTSTGDCRAFTAVAKLAGGPSVETEALPKNVYDERTAALCGATPSPAPQAVRARGSGTLSLHGRNLEITTVFMLLNELSPVDGFIVEGDVNGRVDMDFENVTMAEALEAMKTAGVAFAGPAELRRVCRTKCRPPSNPQQEYNGERVSLILAEADVLDVFRVFREFTGLEIHARELPGTISIYARETPWDRIFDGVLSAIGRKYSIEGTRISLDRNGVPIETLAAAPWRRSLRQAHPVKLAAADVRLAAWTPRRAWARMPGSSKIVLELIPGSPLHDGRVESVNAGRVTLVTDDGRKLTLAP